MKREEALGWILHPKKGPPPGSVAEKQLALYLEGAPEDRALFESQKQLWEVLDEWPAEAPAAAFDRGLMERIADAERPWHQRWFGSLQPAFAVALALIVLAAALVIARSPESAPATVELIEPPRFVVEDYDYYHEIDAALADIEMLADFDVLPLAMPEPGEGRS